jgi:acetoacetyl-CoA synthetase
MANTSNGTAVLNGTHSSSKLLWKHADPGSTPMHKYLKEVNYSYNLNLYTYQELHRWSIENTDAFWQSVWKFVGVRAEGDASPVSATITLMMVKY